MRSKNEIRLVHTLAGYVVHLFPVLTMSSINSPGGAKIINNVILYNFAGERGGGVYVQNNNHALVVNCIVWNNSSLCGENICVFKHLNNPSTLDLSFSNVESGYSSIHIDQDCTLNLGAGMIDSDPEFVNPIGDDFHLKYHSPCKDTGDNSAVTELYDFESDPRIAYNTVDMGADEFHPHLYYTGNASPGESINLKFIGIPDDTVRLWIGSGVLDPPIHHPVYGDWYLEAPILLGMVLGNVPVDGVYVLPVSIPVGYTPWDIPLQAGIGMGLSNLCVVGVE